jgi:hypothetical protein
MEIETQCLTTCEVAADGGAISLGFVDSTGKPATIRLSLNQVGALVMTLPGLIDKALQTRYGDQSLRYAYPLASWWSSSLPIPPRAWSRCAPWTVFLSASRSRASSRANSAKRWWRSRRRRRCGRISEGCS